MNNNAMKLNPTFAKVASDRVINKTIKALTAHGIEAHFEATMAQAFARILKIIPTGAEVFTLSSETLRLSGLAAAINDSGKYISVRNLLNEQKDPKIKRKLGSAPAYAIGSVHALTEDGHLWIVSATGSQLASCVYGAEQVIYVIGAQKIVKDDAAALKRVYDYTLPLESARTQKIFGIDSRIGKLLIINDDKPGRTTVYIVKEKIGF